MRIYAIRTKSVAKFPSNVPCPFQVGCYMAECDNGYGRGLETVYEVGQITFYGERSDAEDMIKACDSYAAKFEIVTFEERRK